MIGSVESFAALTPAARAEAEAIVSGQERIAAGLAPPGPVGISNGRGRAVFHRKPEPRGPMSVFGYDYLVAHIGADKVAGLGLLHHTGLRGSGAEYAYEVLNLVDGRRTDLDITHAVSAMYGPVPVELVLEYLTALESAGLLSRVRP